jgi:hypothetical protein
VVVKDMARVMLTDTVTVTRMASKAVVAVLKLMKMQKQQKKKLK